MAQIVLGDSPLVRKDWMVEGILQKASTSFFSPYIGKTSDSIVQVATTSTASTGHNVVFDYDGAIEVKVIQGMESAFGKGVKKKKFANTLVVDRFTVVVDNYNQFEGVNIGDLKITQHSNSRGLLADGYIRATDQFLFDTAQGCYVNTAPTHIYDLGTTFTINDLGNLEDALATGYGFKSPSATGAVTTNDASRRLPFNPFSMSDGGVYLMVVDNYMARKLRQNPDYQTIIIHGDLRGNENRIISGKIGKLGKILIVTTEQFFGRTEGAGAIKSKQDTTLTLSGLRQYATDGTVDTDTVLEAWEGQDKFDTIRGADKTAIFSRGLVLGAGALQKGNGKSPDYLFESYDFGRESESAMEFWTETQKRVLSLESGEDYHEKLADIDYAVIAVDLKHV